jgi:hypothetical protein
VSFPDKGIKDNKSETERMTKGIVLRGGWRVGAVVGRREKNSRRVPIYEATNQPPSRTILLSSFQFHFVILYAVVERGAG